MGAEEHEHAATHAMRLIPFCNYVRAKHIVFPIPVCQKDCYANQVLQHSLRPLDKKHTKWCESVNNFSPFS